MCLDITKHKQIPCLDLSSISKITLCVSQIFQQIHPKPKIEYAFVPGNFGYRILNLYYLEPRFQKVKYRGINRQHGWIGYFLLFVPF